MTLYQFVGVPVLGPDRHRRPEAYVDVGVMRPNRVERPAAVVAQSNGAQPDRLDRDIVEEPFEELDAALDRHLDVLDDPLERRAAVALLDPVGDVEALVVADQLPVE